jgi:hypothetical protein
MNRQVRIRVNMPVLIRNMSREEGQPVSADDVTQWLRDAGFVQSNDYWIVAEVELGHLDPSEVICVEPINDDPEH